MFFRKKKNKEYQLVKIGDEVFVPVSPDVFRKASVINTRINNEELVLQIKFSTGAIHFVTANLCHRVVNRIAVPIEKPKTRKQKFIVWVLRKFGLSEI